MPASLLERLMEHNNWANDQIIQACLSLTDQQLDAAPGSATMGTIRETLSHLVKSQRGYYRLLTMPVEERRKAGPELTFDQLRGTAAESGKSLLSLLGNEKDLAAKGRVHTTDDFWVDPWLVIVQVINHATEHREQIKSMLTALGVTPPEVDGWAYGEVTRSVVPADK